MDLCHCAEPAPHKVNGSLVCLHCRLYFDEAQWRLDPRVKHAQYEARHFNQEQQDIVNSIMRCAENDGGER